PSAQRRTLDTQKLVYNAFRARVGSCRISICLLITGRSWPELVFARLVFPLKAGDKIIVLEVLQKFLPNSPLDVPCGGETLFFERLDIGWYAHAPDVAVDAHSRLINPPLRHHPVAFQALLQTRCYLSVKVDVIPADDCAQLRDVQ